MKLIKQIEKAQNITDNSITFDLIDDEATFCIVEGNDEYHVSYMYGLWRCDCPDWVYAKDKNLGAYNCKHIIKVISTLYNKKEII